MGGRAVQGREAREEDGSGRGGDSKWPIVSRNFGLT